MSFKDPSLRADAKLFLDDRGYSGHLIRGQPPHLLFEEAVRNRITESYYWKEQCFGLNAATLCDRAADLTFVGGTYSNGQKPAPFLCLAFKMLQLNVERDIVREYLANEDFKYLRALAAFYVRLTSETSEEVYETLEPHLEDYRKLRRRNNQGYTLTFMDQFVDDLLTKERVCATSLWKLVPRQQLEDEDKLDERVSPLAHMLDESDEDIEHGERDEDRDDYQHRPGDDIRSESDESFANGRANGNHSDSDQG